MATEADTKGRGISRRQFLTLAGAGAVVGAVILAATRQKGIQGLLKSATGSQTSQATAGKIIRTPSQPTGPSFLQRLLGGKL
ncbi:MAG TPA: twin-arginine translocation signal domain-containing protein [Thermoplasmata archaeon]|nr:twin-arginine translocation signal domain-containing protein [Thermoplasmata archaeon]